MRVLYIVDNTVPQKVLDEVYTRIKKAYKTTDIDVTATTERRDLSNLPYENYFNGDDGKPNRGIKKSYLKNIAAEVNEKYGKRRFDYVSILVPHKYWTPAKDNIWGWNISEAFHGLEMQQCRVDNSRDRTKRIRNTAGTIHHEQWHAHDQFTYRITGERLKSAVDVSDWDDRVVHGNSPRFSYMRTTKDNADALEAVNPLLSDAFNTRSVQYGSQQYASLVERLVDSNAGSDILQTTLENVRRIINIYTKSDQKLCNSTKKHAKRSCR